MTRGARLENLLDCHGQCPKNLFFVARGFPRFFAVLDFAPRKQVTNFTVVTVRFCFRYFSVPLRFSLRKIRFVVQKDSVIKIKTDINSKKLQNDVAGANLVIKTQKRIFDKKTLFFSINTKNNFIFQLRKLPLRQRFLQNP